jgi:hypothetical protein
MAGRPIRRKRPENYANDAHAVLRIAAAVKTFEQRGEPVVEAVVADADRLFESLIALRDLKVAEEEELSTTRPGHRRAR